MFCLHLHHSWRPFVTRRWCSSTSKRINPVSKQKKSWGLKFSPKQWVYCGFYHICHVFICFHGDIDPMDPIKEQGATVIGHFSLWFRSSDPPSSCSPDAGVAPFVTSSPSRLPVVICVASQKKRKTVKLQATNDTFASFFFRVFPGFPLFQL